MQNKKSRDEARRLNVLFNPENKDESDYIKKCGRHLPAKTRDFAHVAGALDRDLRQHSDVPIPKDISPIHYLTMNKVANIAFRTNITEQEIKCPHCKEKFSVQMPHVKAEANTIAALTNLMDRMFPKLGHLTQEVHLVGQINNVAEMIVGIVVKYVPPEKKMEAMSTISEYLERLENASSQSPILAPADDAGTIASIVA